jgi:hypothetical protein
MHASTSKATTRTLACTCRRHTGMHAHNASTTSQLSGVTVQGTVSLCRARCYCAGHGVTVRGTVSLCGARCHCAGHGVHTSEQPSSPSSSHQANNQHNFNIRITPYHMAGTSLEPRRLMLPLNTAFCSPLKLQASEWAHGIWPSTGDLGCMFAQPNASCSLPATQPCKVLSCLALPVLWTPTAEQALEQTFT